jgi:fructose-bisphosphate aldolase class II
MSDSSAVMLRARKNATVIPAFNVTYLPMLEPVVAALKQCNTFALIEVARLEWVKFGSGSMESVKKEYDKHAEKRLTRLHLDHIPVIDEDNQRVDYPAIIKEAISLGYESVMIDGSRLALAENIAVTREVAELAHSADVPVEAELGAIAGHEGGSAMDSMGYEELFTTRKGFTDVDEAGRFAAETGADWLSVAFGNVHGAISLDSKDKEKVVTRLDVEHCKRIADATNLPLVLHGGSGIDPDYIRRAVQAGICKINIATTIRQAYEQGVAESNIQAAQNVFDACCDLIHNELQIANSTELLCPPAED